MSNVTLISNVHLRADCDIRHDLQFQRQVRGRDALLRLLQLVEPGGLLESAARRHLSAWQQAELTWQTRCAECNAYPFGPVQRDGMRQFEFRCPRGTCPRSSTAPRLLLLNRSMVEQLAARAGLPPIYAIRRFLETHDIRPVDGYAQQRDALWPYPARLSWTQYYSLTDKDIEAELVRTLREERHD